MGKHLQAFVLPHVHTGIFVDGTGITGSQLFQLQAHGLFILLTELRLSGIDDAGNSRRHHIVYRGAITVFFDVDGRYIQCSGTGGRSTLLCVVQGIGIGTPFTTY